MSKSAAVNASVVESDSGQYILIRDEKSSGTAGGTFTLGDWRTRDLNTIVQDETGNVTLSSNQFTLPAGTYRFLAVAPARIVNVHKLRLQNTTDATTVEEGVNTIAHVADSGTTNAWVTREFTITASKTFELQHRSTATQATDGFGVATSFGVEVYATIELVKVA